eukprot:3918293-Amphidinium_carterae.1
MERLSDPSEQRSVLRRARQKNARRFGSESQHQARDDDEDFNPWWTQSSVHEMEKSFQEMEAKLSKFAMFEHEKLDFNRRTGLNEDDLWSTCAEAKDLYDKDLAMFVDARSDYDFLASKVVGAVHASEVLSTQLNPEQSVIVYSDNGGSLMSRCKFVARELRLVLGIQVCENFLATRVMKVPS